MPSFQHNLHHWADQSSKIYLNKKDLKFLQFILTENFYENPFPPQLSDINFLTSLLQDQRLLDTVLQYPGQLPISLQLYFSILLHHAFRKHNLSDPLLIDYLLFILTSHIHSKDPPHQSIPPLYVSDHLLTIQNASPQDKFYLRVDLANKTLLLTSLFENTITARTQKKAAPNLQFYQSIATSQFNSASHHPLAFQLNLTSVFSSLASNFPKIRSTLSLLSSQFTSFGDNFY